jgi:hypothetical protein
LFCKAADEIERLRKERDKWRALTAAALYTWENVETLDSVMAQIKKESTR